MRALAIVLVLAAGIEILVATGAMLRRQRGARGDEKDRL